MLPQADDPTYEPEQVTALLRAVCPELTEGPVVPLGRGWDCDVFAVAGTHVVRLARNLTAAAALVREQALLPRLAPRLPLPIPRPIRLGELPDSALCFGVYELLPGERMASAPFSSAQRGRVAGALGRFVRALHAIELPTDVELPGDELGRMDVSLRSVRTRSLLRALRREGSLSATSVQALERKLDEAEREPLPPVSVLVHADLHDHNLLVSGDHISGVIDWVDLHRGHPAVDLGLAYMQLPREARATFFASYGEVPPALRAWAEWRAITWASSAIVGARERADLEHSAECVQALAEMSQP